MNVDVDCSAETKQQVLGICATAPNLSRNLWTTEVVLAFDVLPTRVAWLMKRGAVSCGFQINLALQSVANFNPPVSTFAHVHIRPAVLIVSKVIHSKLTMRCDHCCTGCSRAVSCYAVQRIH